MSQTQVKRRAPSIDLTGKKFGKWTVESRAEGRFWNCLCECGTRRKTLGIQLRSGRSTRCRRCQYAAQVIDLTGKKFGKWTVGSRAKGEDWNCVCKCGIRKEVPSSTLRAGRSTMCRRCADEAQVIDLTGRSFGKWTVESRAEAEDDSDRKHSSGALWKCRCHCGARKRIFGSHLLSGDTTKCQKCRSTPRVMDLTGKTFGKWTAQARAQDGRWTCECECGRKARVPLGDLRSNKSRACRRCAHDSLRIDLTGKTFGRWTVQSRAEGKLWTCACGTRKKIPGSQLRCGYTTMCRRCADEAQVIDLTGKKFGKWTVESRAEGGFWYCRCGGCNRRVRVDGKSLRKKGRKGSKGCARCKHRSVTKVNLKAPKDRSSKIGHASALAQPEAAPPITAPAQASAVFEQANSDWCDYADLGVEVNWKKRVVRNAKGEEDFSDSPVQWHILRIVWEAYPGIAAVQAIRQGYPGIYGKANRQVNTSKINRRLKLVGIRIVERQLIRISRNSD